MRHVEAGRGGVSAQGGARAGEDAVAAQKDDEAAADVVREDGHGDGGDDAPDDEGVPLPLPDIADEAEGVVAEVFELLAGEREAVGVEEVDAELNEGDEEEQVERGDDVVADLRGDLVEAEEGREQADEQGGEADRGIDADDHAEGEAPCHAARGDSAAELTEQGAEDAAAEELADGERERHREMDGCGWGFGCEDILEGTWVRQVRIANRCWMR